MWFLGATTLLAFLMVLVLRLAMNKHKKNFLDRLGIPVTFLKIFEKGKNLRKIIAGPGCVYLTLPGLFCGSSGGESREAEGGREREGQGRSVNSYYSVHCPFRHCLST